MIGAGTGRLIGRQPGRQADDLFVAARNRFCGSAPVGGDEGRGGTVGRLTDPFLGVPESPVSEYGIVVAEEEDAHGGVWSPGEDCVGRSAVDDAHGRLLGDEQGWASSAGVAGGEEGGAAPQAMHRLALSKNDDGDDGIVAGVETDGAECFFSPVGTTTFESACSGVVLGVEDVESDAGEGVGAAGPAFGAAGDGVTMGVEEGKAPARAARAESAGNDGDPLRSYAVLGPGSGHGTVEGIEQDAGTSWVPRDFAAPVRGDPDIMAGAAQRAWRPIAMDDAVHDDGHDDDLVVEGVEEDRAGNSRQLTGEPVLGSDECKDVILAGTQDLALENARPSIEVAIFATVDYHSDTVVSTEDVDDGIVAGVDEGVIDYVGRTAAGAEEDDGIVAGVEEGATDYVDSTTAGAEEVDEGIVAGVEEGAIDCVGRTVADTEEVDDGFVAGVAEGAIDDVGRTAAAAEEVDDGIVAGVEEGAIDYVDSTTVGTEEVDEGIVAGAEEGAIDYVGSTVMSIEKVDDGIVAGVAEGAIDYVGSIVAGTEEVDDGIVAGVEEDTTDYVDSTTVGTEEVDEGIVAGVEEGAIDCVGSIAVSTEEFNDGVVAGVEQGAINYVGSTAVHTKGADDGILTGVEECAIDYVGSAVVGTEEVGDGIVAGVEEAATGYIQEATWSGHGNAATAEKQADGVLLGVGNDVLEQPGLPAGPACSDQEGDVVEGAEGNVSGYAGCPDRPAGRAGDEGGHGIVEGAQEATIQFAGPSFEIGVLTNADCWDGQGIVEGV
ncbi:unnamed protein product [Ostreobium quekettii]|uniref:Uncharacterized protein n=1 Tax=Ostreobium quekettii TaxID=121088 RepID=A0A8S1JDX4_9CHLO|nr:unnamed protein product [Ostreobium quekettii]